MKTENQVRERELATGDVPRVCLGDIEGAAYDSRRVACFMGQVVKLNTELSSDLPTRLARFHIKLN